MTSVFLLTVSESLIIRHALFWCLRAAVMWRGCESKMGLRVRMGLGAPKVLLTAWRWNPGVLGSRTPPRASEFLCNETVGLLLSNILLPPSTCLHVTRNEAVTTCSSSRRSSVSHISAHDLACLPPPTISSPFLPASLLVPVPSLPS